MSDAEPRCHYRLRIGARERQCIYYEGHGGEHELAYDPQPKPGDKYDTGKARYDLTPPYAYDELVRVLTYGAGKYTPNGYKLVEGWRARYFAAGLRHAWAYWRGEEHDEESGLHHLAHAVCCLLFMLEMELEGTPEAEDDFDAQDYRRPCGMCGAEKQSPEPGVRCGQCGVRRGDDKHDQS